MVASLQCLYDIKLMSLSQELFIKMFGSLSRTRTYDPVINSHLLYQLSYQGIKTFYDMTL